MHGVVEEVSRRFAELEEKLQETKGTPEHKNIKKRIFVEYLEKKRDKEHQRAKQRFQYLHDKLSHIKRLVLEYDEKNAPHEGKYWRLWSEADRAGPIRLFCLSSSSLLLLLAVTMMMTTKTSVSLRLRFLVTLRKKSGI